MKLVCPACTANRDPGKYLCRNCWWLLPEPTRRVLRKRGAGAIRRLQELYDALNAGTPLTDIYIAV